MSDPYDLNRFVEAQAPVYEQVRTELTYGRKRTHWMWFVFPQLTGLGSSEMSKKYAISSLDEAKAYLDHPVLGPRLRECVALLGACQVSTISAIMGTPDDLKLRSSLTLFWYAALDRGAFERVINKYYAGGPDPKTLALL